ncbi:MAG: cupin domain-containing protein [Tabrizicola sp.]|jgi:uncharacterized cupin superfamily protein|nr:cupin domain-containing protein [Tabrizicola sp.]
MIVDPARVPCDRADNGGEILYLSKAGGLTQFGAYIDTLMPGAWSSQRHWHSAEDEFLYLLSGTLTLVDDHGETEVFPGDAICWRHGAPNAHHLTNRGDVPARFLIVGSRCKGDICTYPDEAKRQVNGDTTWQIVTDDGEVIDGGDLPEHLLNLRAPWGMPFDGTPRPNVLRAGSVRQDYCTNYYPAEFSALGDAWDIALSDAGGLTQFGAFLEILNPGGQTSLRHWHEEEDEFLYLLDGTVTLLEDDGPRLINPGTCVAWPAGVPNAHCLRNDGTEPATLFIVGSRFAEDACHYPDIDLHYSRRNGLRSFTRKDGTPYPGWPKETNR